MSTEAEKKKYGVSQGGSIKFIGHCHFSDAILGGTTHTKEMLDHKNYLLIQRSAALVLILPSMSIYLDLRKNFCYGTGNLGSAWYVFETGYVERL